MRCLLFLVAWKEGCCCGGGEVLRACAACVCACVPCYEGSARGLLACGVHLASWCHGGAWCLPLRGSYKHTHTHTHTHRQNNIRERKKNNSVLFSGVLPEEISPPLLLLVVVVISSSLLPFLSPPSLFSVSYVVFVCLLVFSGYTHQGIWWSLCRSLFPLCYFLASDASSHHSLSSIIMKTTHPQAAGGI